MMKKYIKYILPFFLLLGANTRTLFAQKYADLQMSIAEPQDGEIIPYGDSVFIKISVKNLGPDTLHANQDTFYYTTSVIPVASSDWADLNPGDSSIYTVLFKLNDGNHEDVSESICLYFLPYSSTYMDTIQTNDSSCVSYTLQGNDNTGITKIPENTNNGFDVYPNPSSQKIALRFNLTQEQSVSISIYDIWSRQILQRKLQLPSGQQNLPIDISNLNPGLYWIKLGIDNKNKEWTMKLSVY